MIILILENSPSTSMGGSQEGSAAADDALPMGPWDYGIPAAGSFVNMGTYFSCIETQACGHLSTQAKR